MGISQKLSLIASVVVVVVGVGSASASAETLVPWWHLTSSASPSYIEPGQGKDDLQRVTVTASTGSYTLHDQGVGPRIEGASQETGVAVGEAPNELQEALEGMYGAGNIEVTSPCTGVPSSACTEVNSRYEVYEVKFVGKLTDRYVAPMGADGETQQEGPVTIEEIAKGRPDGTIVLSAANLGDAANPTECVDVGVGHGDYADSGCTQKRRSEEGEFEQRLKEPVKISDKLPAGLTVVGIEGTVDEWPRAFGRNNPPLECALSSVSCTFTGTPPPVTFTFENANSLVEEYPASVSPYNIIKMVIGVKASGARSVESTEASITGGGAPAASVKAPLTVSNAPIPFGLTSYEMRAEEVGGGVDTQAGSHPFQYTTSFAITENAEGTSERKPTALDKDLYFKLPPGIVGNPTALPQCSSADFLSETCPQDTVVGVSRGDTRLLLAKWVDLDYANALINLEPAPGEPARFGFIVNEHGFGPKVPVYLKTGIRTGGDYGVTVTVRNISQIVEFISSEAVFWGVPGYAAHDSARTSRCLASETYRSKGEPGAEAYEGCQPFQAVPHPSPLLTLPTSCSGPLHTTLETDSWLEPDVLESSLNTEPMLALDGCNRLPFAPEIKVSPDSQQASKPTGLTVNVHVPQEGQLNPTGLAQSNVKNITVALPAGVTLNPSSGDGLQACSASTTAAPGAGQLGAPGDQIGFEGFGESPLEPGVSNPDFTAYLPGSVNALANGFAETLQPGQDFCPNPSKIAEATITTPLLPKGQSVKGFVYLAAQEANPFDSVLAMYIVAEDPVSGSLVKLPGEVQLCKGAGEVLAGQTCEALGQIVSTFEDNPQLPFEDAELHFFGGERAPLASPSHCGKYTTNATFTPWSGGEPVHSSSSFEITSGPNGSSCPSSSLPFNPALTGGATNVNAGAFSPFTATMSRLPGEQNLQSLEVKLPEGLSGILTGVELCPEPQANLGECGPNSLIGETTVAVGVGGDPYTVTGGKFYLTGPYNGSGACTVGTSDCAPFGITFEVPAKAGPFDFANTKGNHPACDCVLVRGKIEINLLTTAITITSNPPGTPDAIPTSIEGIPLEIQHVNAITTRNDFQFNPTNCSKMAVTGTIHSSEGAADTIGVPLQVTNCAFLKFTPKFKVSVGAKTSKAYGASLTTSVTEPAGSLGTQANLAKVKVELPKDLPSRLTTLQKACTSKQFELNPANCPSESKIGYAVVHTPLVPVPLEGPAIFVSHGGEAFPSLTMVLQGYGITIDLVGTTFISKSGVTSTTFKTVPDQPFSSFALTLPTGKYSALTALGNVCTESLKMPTEFIGQNGAVVKQNTAISVTGCAKAKALTRAQKLKAALKACHKDKKKAKRQSCERSARKRYGPPKKAKKKGKR